jgi:hypothetical protein
VVHCARILAYDDGPAPILVVVVACDDLDELLPPWLETNVDLVKEEYRPDCRHRNSENCPC